MGDTPTTPVQGVGAGPESVNTTGIVGAGRLQRAQELTRELRARGVDVPLFQQGKGKVSHADRQRREEAYIRALASRLKRLDEPPRSGWRVEKRCRAEAAQSDFLEEMRDVQIAPRVVWVTPGTRCGSRGAVLTDGTCVPYKDVGGYSYLSTPALHDTIRVEADPDGGDQQLVEARRRPTARRDQGEVLLRVAFRRVRPALPYTERRSAHLMYAPRAKSTHPLGIDCAS